MRSPVGFVSIYSCSILAMTMTHIHMASAIKYAAHCKLEELSAITVEWDQGQQFFFQTPETTPNIIENDGADPDPDTDTESGNNRHLRGSVNGSAERSLDRTKQNREKFKALNCPCVNGKSRPATLCIAKEDYDKRLAMCSVPSDPNLPVKCLSTTKGEIFARNAWPITLLWLISIFIYAFITEGGRLGLKYMFSCCCFFWCKNVSNSHRDFIEEIIRREADTRRRFQRVAVERQNSGRDGPYNRDGSSGPITYILKTKQYMSDKKKVDSESTTSEKTAPLSPENIQDSDENPTTKHTITEPLSPESTVIQQDSDQNPTPIPKHTENVDITNELLCRPCGDVEGDIGGESNGDANIYANLDFSDEEFDEDAVVCTICIMNIEDGDRIGALPCEHEFHVDCLKEWIKRKNVCPLCQCPDIAREKGSPLDSSTVDGNSDDNERESEDENELHNSPTVRTTGARVDPDEVTSSGRRRRRRRMMNSRGGNTNVSRRLFHINGRAARSTVRVNARNTAGADHSGSFARQSSILVGDPASNGNSLGDRRIESIPRISSTVGSIMVTRRATNRQMLEERRERMVSLRARSAR